MADNQATIILKNGQSYKSPMSNLENVRRIVNYSRIILPGEDEETEMEMREERGGSRRGRKSKKQTN